MANRQYLIPGGGYINQTGNNEQVLIPGVGVVNDNPPAAGGGGGGYNATQMFSIFSFLLAMLVTR